MPAISPITLMGYLKIPDIPGESTRADHEGEIDVHRIRWSVLRAASAAIGSGRVSARAKVSPVHLDKWYDASSPYLALAVMQGKAFPEAAVTFRKDLGDAHLDYLTITLTNVAVSSYEILDEYNEVDEPIARVPERIGLSFETVKIRYIAQSDDHSAGDVHEIAYDVARGR